jgi:hypothetical protein
LTLESKELQSVLFKLWSLIKPIHSGLFTRTA